MKTKIHIAIADDHGMIRIGLERVLALMEDMRIVAQYADFNQVLQGDLRAVDVLVLDLNMPGSDGFTVLQTLSERYPDLRIVVFSMLPEDSFAPRSFAAGASGYVNKNQPPEELITAIRTVVQCGRYLSMAQEDMLLALEAKTDGPLHDSLSEREFSVLVLLAGGCKPTDVAKQLNLKMGTVTTHIFRIKRKLGAQSIGDLVAYAHRHSLV